MRKRKELSINKLQIQLLKQLHKWGQQVRLVGLKFPVSVSWYYLKRDRGKLEKRFVLSTKPLKARAILLGGVNADGEPARWTGSPA